MRLPYGYPLFVFLNMVNISQPDISKPNIPKPFYRFTSFFPAAVVSALPLVALSQRSAQAVSFQFSFNQGVSSELKASVQQASKAWADVLKDEAVINLRVEYSDLSDVGASVLGGAQPGKVKVKYEDYIAALYQDAISSIDIQAISGLQMSSENRDYLQDFQMGDRRTSINLQSDSFSFLMDGRFNPSNPDGADFLDNNDNNNNRHILLTRAQAKALNLKDAEKSKLDAVIKLNSQVNWDLNPSNGVASDRYSLESVVQHEIGHALGIVSGVDSLDFLASSSEPINIEEDSFSYLTPMDFYRYSAESEEYGVMDLTLGGEKYFSLDRGQSAVRDQASRVAAFSTGTFSSGGDGYQGSHWRETDDNPLGVMNPSLQAGETNRITQLDLTLLDAIGWNLEDTNEEKAQQMGVYWSEMQDYLARERAQVIDGAIAQWGDDIPALEVAMADAAIEIDSDFREEVQKSFEKLEDKLEGEYDYGKRQQRIAKFYQDVWEASDERNEALAELPSAIYEMDAEVSEWLYESEDELAKELKDANATEVNRLSHIVKAASPSEREYLEPRLEAALFQFVDEADQLVQELLDTSGPSNPIGYGDKRQWWFQFQVSDDFDGDELNYYSVGDSPLLYQVTSQVASQPASQVASQVASSSEAIAPPGTEPPAGLRPLSAAQLTASNFQPASSGAQRQENWSDRTFDTLSGTAGTPQDIPEPSSALAMFGIAVLGAKVLHKKCA